MSFFLLVLSASNLLEVIGLMSTCSRVSMSSTHQSLKCEKSSFLPENKNGELIRNLLFANPLDLVQGDRRLSKDEGFAIAVQDVWGSDLSKIYGSKDKESWIKDSPIYSRFVYNLNDSIDNSQTRPDKKEVSALDSPLYGTLVQGVQRDDVKVPGIVLFHTGAGPSDIFIYWKADSIISSLEVKPIVLIADLVSDNNGECWESEFWSKKRKELMTIGKNNDGIWCRTVLQHRIKAGVEAIKSLPQVDEKNIGVMGWCLGGRAVAELARMRLEGVTCATSFHG